MSSWGTAGFSRTWFYGISYIGTYFYLFSFLFVLFMYFFTFFFSVSLFVSCLPSFLRFLYLLYCVCSFIWRVLFSFPHCSPLFSLMTQCEIECCVYLLPIISTTSGLWSVFKCSCHFALICCEKCPCLPPLLNLIFAVVFHDL